LLGWTVLSDGIAGIVNISPPSDDEVRNQVYYDTVMAPEI
jgi:hypothetical protein